MSIANAIYPTSPGRVSAINPTIIIIIASHWNSSSFGKEEKKAHEKKNRLAFLAVCMHNVLTTLAQPRANPRVIIIHHHLLLCHYHLSSLPSVSGITLGNNFSLWFQSGKMLKIIHNCQKIVFKQQKKTSWNYKKKFTQILLLNGLKS